MPLDDFLRKPKKTDISIEEAEYKVLDSAKTFKNSKNINNAFESIEQGYLLTEYLKIVGGKHDEEGCERLDRLYRRAKADDAKDAALNIMLSYINIHCKDKIPKKGPVDQR